MEQSNAQGRPAFLPVLRTIRDAVPPAMLLAGTGWVVAGGLVALLVVAMLPAKPMGSELAPVLILQGAGIIALLVLRHRAVALVGLGMASAGPFVLASIASPTLLLATCLVPLAGWLVLAAPAQRVAALAGYGWILPVMHTTFGYAGLGYALPLFVVLAASALALVRLPLAAYPHAALYLGAVLFLGYA